MTCRPVVACLVLSVLLTVQITAAVAESPFGPATCEGLYPKHLQGICTDNRQHIFWSFTNTIVKTDVNGKILKRVSADNHQGDLCYLDGRLYVAVNLGRFNDPQKRADSWVYVFDAENLELLARHPLPELVYGAGAIAYHDGHFLVTGGLPVGAPGNLVYLYDRDFHLVKKQELPGGYTFLGIQTATFADDHWWFGCYGKPTPMLVVSSDFKTVREFNFTCCLGIVGLDAKTFLVARGIEQGPKQLTGKVLIAVPDDKSGLAIKK